MSNQLKTFRVSTPNIWESYEIEAKNFADLIVKMSEQGKSISDPILVSEVVSTTKLIKKNKDMIDVMLFGI